MILFDALAPVSWAESSQGKCSALAVPFDRRKDGMKVDPMAALKLEAKVGIAGKPVIRLTPYRAVMVPPRRYLQLQSRTDVEDYMQLIATSNQIVKDDNGLDSGNFPYGRCAEICFGIQQNNVRRIKYSSF